MNISETISQFWEHDKPNLLLPDQPVFADLFQE